MLEDPQERLAAFERMLADLETARDGEKAQMDQLRAQGKDKTARFKELMANRLLYGRFMAYFQRYGLR